MKYSNRLVPQRVRVQRRDGRSYETTVWKLPGGGPAQFDMFADQGLHPGEQVIGAPEKRNRGASRGIQSAKDRRKLQTDIFDEAGMHEELRDQYREKVRQRRRQNLSEPWHEGKPMWAHTLADYAELSVLRGARLDRLSGEELRRMSATNSIHLEDRPFWHPDNSEPDEAHRQFLQDRIDDKIELYREMGGMYSMRGALTHRRKVEQALAAGLPVPAAVLADYPDLRRGPKLAVRKR